MLLAFIIFIVTLSVNLMIKFVKDDLMFGKNSNIDGTRDIIHVFISILASASASLLSLIVGQVYDMFAKYSFS